MKTAGTKTITATFNYNHNRPLKTESNRAYFRTAIMGGPEICQAFGLVLVNKENAFAKVGQEYIAQNRGRIGGGRGQDWADDGIEIEPGDKFVLASPGDAATPSLWKVYKPELKP